MTTKRDPFSAPVAASAQAEVLPPSTHAFAEQAIAIAKRDGMFLAVRARWIALAVIAALVPLLNPHWEVIYYEFLIVLSALIGWAHLKVARVGQSYPELALLFCDLALLTIVTVLPNPLRTVDWPTAMQYRFDNFIYFFVFLAAGTLAYSWRTVVAVGTWTAGLWSAGLVAVSLFPNAKPDLTEALAKALDTQPRLLSILDPNSIELQQRIQEIVVFVIVAFILAVTVRRANDLVATHADVVRERTNLARYFSPNVVEELSHNDDPLKQVRTQDVAVLFVDIVGFTSFAEGRDARDVITTLRAFHAAMEAEVFRHGGTLDKYLGDGLMATFGTPVAGANDATNALTCCAAMIEAVDRFNERRSLDGLPAIRASFGVHYGPVVLGDIGANRLEFAVIGNTVNVASRLEGLSRPLDAVLVVSEDIVQRARQEEAFVDGCLAGLAQVAPQAIRGLEAPLVVWTRARRQPAPSQGEPI